MSKTETSKQAIETERKITTSVFGNRDMTKAKEENIMLFKLIGKARGHVEKFSQFGLYITLLGDFIAIDPEGKMKRSEKLILPGYMIDMIMSELSKPEAQDVEFAFEISTKPDSKCATGYVYVCTNLMKPQGSDDALLAIAKAKGIIPQIA